MTEEKDSGKKSDDSESKGGEDEKSSDLKNKSNDKKLAREEEENLKESKNGHEEQSIDGDDESTSEKDGDENDEEEEVEEDDENEVKKETGSEDGDSENADQPVQVEGKRKRVQVDRLSFASPVVNSPARSSLVGSGTGKTLGSFPHIETNINKVHSLQLKLLHRLLYTYTSKINLIKREVRSFNGFSFKPESKEYQKKNDFLNKLNHNDLKVMKQVLGMKSRVKKDLIDELLTFLCEPTEQKFSIPKKKHVTPKSNGEPKAKRSRISVKTAESNESQEEGTTDDEYEKKEEVIQKFSNRAKEAKNLAKFETSPKVEDPEEVTVDSKEKVEAVKVKSTGKTDSSKTKSLQKPKAVKAKSSEETKVKVTEKDNKKKVSESSNTKAQTSKKKKNICSDSNPTDDMIVKMIRELLNGADLTMISMRQMINTLHECFPNASFEGRKAFLKEKVIHVVQE